MFKYTPINSHTLQNLQNNQIYFNNPLNFNDPFDTRQPVAIKKFSNKTLALLFSQYYKKDYNEDLLKILDKKMPQDDFYKFCNKNIEYFFDFDKENEKFIFQSKKNYLEKIKTLKNNSQLFPGFEDLFNHVKTLQNRSIQNFLEEKRVHLFSKFGISCFSKNNTNLIMWSHYADCHKGLCLEFNSHIAPFNKSFEVIYDSNFPKIDTKILFEDEHSLEIIRKFLTYKSKDWKHEQEIRILHQEKNTLFRYSRLALKSIYFGIETSETDKAIICSLMRAQNPEVKFYTMEKLDNSFGIEPKEFIYSTPMEVQSMLIIKIINLFKNKCFSSIELNDSLNNIIEKENLENHLIELVRIKFLEKTKSKFKLKN